LRRCFELAHALVVYQTATSAWTLSSCLAKPVFRSTDVYVV